MEAGYYVYGEPAGIQDLERMSDQSEDFAIEWATDFPHEIVFYVEPEDQPLIAWRDYHHQAERTVTKKVYLSLENHRELAEITGWFADDLANYYYDARARRRSITITMTTRCELEES